MTEQNPPAKDGPAVHPLREELTNEVHARPFMAVTSPLRASHLALHSGEAAQASDRDHVARLCKHFGQEAPPADASVHVAEFDGLKFKWERHTEFSSYSFFEELDPAAPPSETAPFSATALDRVPADWLAEVPGALLVGLHAQMLAETKSALDPFRVAAIFGQDNFAGSSMSGGAARAWMDFALNDDGFGHILVEDKGLRPRQAGRLLQRLFEIETYRMMALLALPLAREEMPRLGKTAQRLVVLTDRMSNISELDDERKLLDELTELSQTIERTAAATGFRFSAARAYYELVERRIAELREERIEGSQTIREFMDRRLSPAMRTCEAVGDRLDRLSRRLARAGQLLRTRVDIELEAQNSDLLQSMNRRAQLQLRLQQTVEGLSVVAISYYLVSLIGYLAKAGKAAGVGWDPDLVTGLAVIPVIGLVFMGVRRVRRLVTQQAPDAGERQP